MAHDDTYVTHLAGRGSLGSPVVEDGPGFFAMIGFVAALVATVILVFFGVGYLLGKLLL